MKLHVIVLCLAMLVLASCGIQTTPSEGAQDTPVGFATLEKDLEKDFEVVTDEEEASHGDDMMDDEESMKDDEEMMDDEPASEDSEENADEPSEEPSAELEVVDAAEEVTEEPTPVAVESYLATITATEGDLVSLAHLTAEDPDGTPLTYSYSSPVGEDGTWQTADGDEGEYLVTITVSDGFFDVSEDIQIIIASLNKAPVINCPASVSANEGETIDLDCELFDPDGDAVEHEVSGFMDDFTYTTSFQDAGEYEVLISATDGDKESTHVVAITVANTNRAPSLDLDDVEVVEGDLVDLDAGAEDADGDAVSFTYPEGYSEDGTWQTEIGDAGTYDVVVSATDGVDTTAETITVVVLPFNAAPTIEAIEDITVDEGETITLDIVASDDSGDVTVEISGFMTEESYTTTFEDAGEHTVTITASDGELETSIDVAITVNNVNRPPVFVLN